MSFTNKSYYPVRNNILVILLLLLLSVGCGGSKGSASQKTRTISVAAAHKDRTGTDPVSAEATKAPSAEKEDDNPASPKANDIINTALTYSGVRYKFGGTTKRGMDCSGLLYVSFGAHQVPLPRTSYQMAEKGKRIGLRQVTKGDLLFFKTKNKGKRINHVGLVVSATRAEIKFIHASSSRGVTVSSLREGYWSNAFVKATRIL